MKDLTRIVALSLSALCLASGAVYAAPNDVPTIGGTPATSVDEDSVYSFTPVADDVDVGDLLTFSIVNQPSWSVFDIGTGALTGTPTNGDVGTHPGIVISVDDGEGGNASLPAFDLTVNNTNDVPTIGGAPPTSVDEDSAYSFVPNSHDVDVGDVLTFGVANKPSWASFDNASGFLYGTPRDFDVGTHSAIVISVDDGKGGSASLAAFDITVNNVHAVFWGDAGDSFGCSVSGAGDVNGDGYADIVVGARGDDNAGTDSGHLTVISGVDGAVLFTLNGWDAGENFGRSVAGAGDVNGDGYADIVVGAFGVNNNGIYSGSARVFSVIDGAVLHNFNSDDGLDNFGTSVSGAGDVNNDGYADIVVGASGDDSNGENSGSARVLSGIDGAVLYTFNGDDAGDYFGGSVSGAGDVNMDGYADIVVGASVDSNNGTFSGSARVLSGIDGTVLYTFNGDSAWDLFGTSVSGAGDVNNDGYADIVVGTIWDDNNGENSGSARVLSGIDGAVLYTFNGDGAGDHFGTSVSGVGDVNMDGYADIVVGASMDNNNGSYSGSARVLSGIDGAVLYSFNGGLAGDYFGCSVSGAGDVNMDGYADIVVGADGGGSNFGYATIFYSNLVAGYPSFTSGGVVISTEDEGPVTISAWATGINENGGTGHNFAVTPDDPSVFSIAPVIDAATGDLTFTTAADVNGSTSFDVTFYSDQYASGTVTVGLTITPVNDAPTIAGAPATSVDEDSAYSFIPVADDVDVGDVLTFSIVNQPSWASFDNASGVLTGTPTNDDVGTYSGIVISVDDGEGGNASLAAFDITVINTNDVPTIVGAPATSVDEGSAYSFTPFVEDVDVGDVLTFGVANKPSWAVFDIGTGALTGTPTNDDVGTHSAIVISVDDGKGGSASLAAFDITVINTNDAPSFTAGADQEVLEDAGPQVVANWASDLSAGPSSEADQSLTFTVTTGNDGLFSVLPTVDGATGDLSYESAPDANGSAILTIFVSDDGGTVGGGVNTSASQVVLLTVNPVNDAPSFSAGADQTVLEDAGLQIVANWATDVSAGPSNEEIRTLSFAVTTDNDELFSQLPTVDGTTGDLSYEAAPDANGSATLSVYAMDNGGTVYGGEDTSATQSATITVTPVNDPPVLSIATSNIAYTEGDPGVSFLQGVTIEDVDDVVMHGAFLLIANFIPSDGDDLSVNPVGGITSNLKSLGGNDYGLFLYGKANLADYMQALSSITFVNAGDDPTRENVARFMDVSVGDGSDASDAVGVAITITPVNDPPSFVAGPDQQVLEGAASQHVPAWATQLDAVESGQTLTFTVTTDNDELFSQLPTVDGTTGDLSYEFAPDANGSATLSVYVMDNGGTFYGGMDTSETQTALVTVAMVNVSDNCDDPMGILGDGIYPFDVTLATTGYEGQNEALCIGYGSTAIESDVWFLWTADTDGTVNVSTCDDTSADTKIAAYPSGGCPTDGSSLACNDNAVGCAVRFSSSMDFACVAGTRYLIQVGAMGGAAGTTGNVTITQTPGSPEPGTAYCFGDGSGTACPCGNEGGAGEGCVNDTGNGAVLSASGTASVAADDLVLSATNLTSGPGLFFQGNNAVNSGNGNSFGDGLRCAGFNVVRLEVQFSNAANGFTADSTISISTRGGVSVGQTKRYQFWYRDSGGSPCNSQFNLTNGYEITWGA